MTGSGTIRVIKRDRSLERFDAAKLAAAMGRAMGSRGVAMEHARQLADAVEIYLRRRRVRCVTSSALWEMALKALWFVGLSEAAEAAERYRDWRQVLRRRLRVRHDGGKVTYWEKGWLSELAGRSWHVLPTTARIAAGEVEMILLRQDAETVSREEVTDTLNRVMSEFGLADAVPVNQ